MKSIDDEMMEDDHILKLLAMPLKILANSKLDTISKFLMAVVPDGERVKRSWGVNDPGVIKVPYPSSIFKNLKLEQCYMFGFISYKHMVEQNFEYKTTLIKLSKNLGMKTTETYKHLSTLVKKGFLKKRIENKKIILSIHLGEKYDSWAEKYKGSKILQMTEKEMLEYLE